jgi:hypothetical protein
MTRHHQSWIWNRTSAMVAVLASALVFATAWRAADVVDKVTGLPLHPGLEVQQEVNSPVCGHPAHIVLYDTPSTATLAEYLSWYRSQLKGAHYVHKVWSNRAQEMFYSADGSTGVSLTANASGPGVYSVAYMKISAPPLSTKQMDAFEPSNPQCK